ncbi:uncharacterized protein LOC115760849 [Drosophila novamexicana]|uniref:uncharacterized protein LOC115760849 n=1 Tax=Drosophila novamexicana TaxID=47314 RepID=UPI0011E5FB83|nr:uncharacterized protein LOC115760849 [Drosophila novamexicana]
MEAEAESETSKSTQQAEKLNVLCGICNEFYKANDIIYSTASCGHVFHKECLTRWLSRSLSCPQCRAICHRHRVHRIYLNFAECTEIDDPERSQIQWVPIDLDDPVAPTTPEGAVQCGTDHEGFDTYVARVYLHEDLLPANYVPQKKAVYAPWNCSAHRLNSEVDLLVLTDCELKWVAATNGDVPPGALKSGYSEIGEALYTGRSVHAGLTLLGKVHPSHRVIYMPYQREEVSNRIYEVLVVTPKEQAER